ncbi:uncharacterized protein J3D65DRAFT_601414 [Phyllosticta citribraziliensis]|uniref:DDE Tnp4 domain-containing protein n=1 Tax=Phyllosticta citribraziliensis TaxID=989973 RepID=A0ABR1LVU8_9PEZI
MDAKGFDIGDDFYGVNTYQILELAKKLAHLDSDARLVETEELSEFEQAAIFLLVSRSCWSTNMASDEFLCSRRSVSHAFTNVREALLAMYDDYVKPPPSPVMTADMLPEVRDDPRFEYFGGALKQLVGAVAILPIGASKDVTIAIGDKTTKAPSNVLVGTPLYTGPQHAVLMFSVHGAITAVYAPGYANAGPSPFSTYPSTQRDILALACLAGERVLPPLPPDTRLLAPAAAAGDTPFSPTLPLMGPFADAAYPTTHDEQDAITVADGAHALFNLRHAQLYEILAERPLRQLCERFALLLKPGAKVSAATLKAFCVLHGVLDELGEKGIEEWLDEGSSEEGGR